MVPNWKGVAGKHLHVRQCFLIIFINIKKLIDRERNMYVPHYFIFSIL